MTDLSNWQPCARPGKVALKGAYAHVEPIKYDAHIDGLFTSVCGEGNEGIWTYLPGGSFKNPTELKVMLRLMQAQYGWEIMVIRGAQTAEILGMASYMRNREEHGSTEVGCVTFSRKLQRSRTATDAMYLMARHIFQDLGYRRYEWKCDNRNEASKRAALRFGFQYEGLFRNDMVRNGESRDTAWYAMTDYDWPAADKAFRAWLDVSNFDAAGQQINKLAGYRTG